MFKYLIIICFSVYAIIFLWLCSKTKHFFKTLILNVFIGIISLVILCLTYKFTGLKFNINRLTVLVSSTMGIPGILTLLMLNFIL